MTEPSTKERILDAAEAIMLEKSFHAVGLNEILKAVGVPKGSFYHHFNSKEDFGVQMLKHYVADASAYKRRALLSPEPEADPRRRLLTFLESNIARLIDSQGKCPCLVLKLASEVADFSEPMRQVLANGSREWDAIVEELIHEGIQQGTIAENTDAATTARLIGSLWTGAMHQAVISRNAEPLRDALACVKNVLLPAPGARPGNQQAA